MGDSSKKGIDAISVYSPQSFIDLKTLAKANKTDFNKYYYGLGGRKMAIPMIWEDTLTMAVKAAASLLGRYEINTDAIGLLIVGTETGLDAAKPVSAYLHGLLSLSPQCRTFDTKHACYGATAGLRAALDWLDSPSGQGKQALVVASDIARYDLSSPGEPTQGAGAVAMLIGKNPRLLTIDPFPEGVYSDDVMDFWRPHYRANAVVNGHASIESYLKALKVTFHQYRKTSGFSFADYQHILYHVPFPKMAFKAHKALVGERGLSERSLEESFEALTGESLWANREFGNIYTGSLYLSIAGLLSRAKSSLKGHRLGLFSYGSGCCAEFFSGVVEAEKEAYAGKIGLEATLASRKELTFEEYAKIREALSDLTKNGSFGFVSLDEQVFEEPVAFCGLENHKRRYAVNRDALARLLGEAKPADGQSLAFVQ